MKSILTPRQFAEAIGVSESSVKRWVDDGHIVADRTAGGHRRITVQEAVRYIRQHGTAVVRPDILGLSDLATAAGSEPVKSEGGDQLFDYLQAGAAAEVRGFILSRYFAGSSVAEIIDGPLAYAMEKIGELWTASPSGVFWEHRATQIAIQAIGRLRLLLTPRQGAFCAIGGAPSGDRYLLPSLSVAAVLEGEGFAAINLGPETPIPSLALGVEDAAARLAWLSITVAEDTQRLRSQILALLPAFGAAGVTLLVGGREASKLSLPKSEALYVGRTLGELEALVQGMRIAPGATQPEA